MSAIDVLASVVATAPDVAQMSETGDDLVLRSDEITLTISSIEDGWRVRKTWRNQDRGVVFQSDTVEDVARYISSLLANDIRQSHGVAPLRRRLVLSEDGIAVPTDGFELSGDSESGFILSGGSHRVPRYFASDLEAAKFSYLADDDLDTIRALLTGA